MRDSPRYKWYALAAVMLGTLMAPLDSSIANVALPTIGRAFHTWVDNTEWVLLAYMLTTSSTLVLFGRLGNHHEHVPGERTRTRDRPQRRGGCGGIVDRSGCSADSS
jgi:MFS family permease